MDPEGGLWFLIWLECYGHPGRWRETFRCGYRGRWRWRSVCCGLTAAAVAAGPGSGVGSSVAALPAAAGPAASSVSALADVAVQPGVQHAGRVQASPPTTADCEKAYKVACYEPAQIQQAYDLPAVYASGVTGKGATIVIVDSFGSPTIKNDLGVFDRTFRPARAAVVPGHPARGQGARLRPGQLRHGRLGRRDHAGRGVRAHDRAGRQHPAGRDAGVGDRGRARLPADRHGRGVRAQAPPRRRDQPELQRHRADLPQRGRGPGAARRLPAGRPATTSRCSPPRATPAPPTSGSTRPPTTRTR